MGNGTIEKKPQPRPPVVGAANAPAKPAELATRPSVATPGPVDVVENLAGKDGKTAEKFRDAIHIVHLAVDAAEHIGVPKIAALTGVAPPEAALAVLKGMKYGFTGLAAAGHAAVRHQRSSAGTAGGKAAEAVSTGAGYAAVCASLPVSVVEAVAPKGLKPSEIYDGGAAAAVAMAEAWLTGDLAPAVKVQNALRRGDHGVAMQGFVKLGDLIADIDLSDGLRALVSPA